jgi:hypothetical protein
MTWLGDPHVHPSDEQFGPAALAIRSLETISTDTGRSCRFVRCARGRVSTAAAGDAADRADTGDAEIFTPIHTVGTVGDGTIITDTTAL